MYNIVLVGCGATGSNLATFVSQLAISSKKINEIILIDGDEVEAKNFRNQKFTQKDIGKNKANVLSNRFSKLGINISYIDKYLRSEEELINIIKSFKKDDTTILVGAVDNNKARRYLNDTFNSDEVPELIYIDTGNGDVNRCGQTVIGAKTNNKVIKPPVAEYYPQILEDEIEKPIDYKCSNIEEHPQNLATNILSATTTFLMINNIISLGKVGRVFARFDADLITIK